MHEVSALALLSVVFSKVALRVLGPERCSENC